MRPEVQNSFNIPTEHGAQTLQNPHRTWNTNPVPGAVLRQLGTVLWQLGPVLCQLGSVLWQLENCLQREIGGTHPDMLETIIQIDIQLIAGLQSICCITSF